MSEENQEEDQFRVTKHFRGNKTVFRIFNNKAGATSPESAGDDPIAEVVVNAFLRREEERRAIVEAVKNLGAVVLSSAKPAPAPQP